MRLHVNELILSCRQSEERIPFGQFSYFYGQMGAGKSSIARLVDYCLGGDLDEFTPALQHEFVAANLLLNIEGTDLSLYRERESNQVRARWDREDGAYDVVIPARSASGERIPGTGVEVVSDLVFFLAGMEIPRVRRSKLRRESENVRLSLRDMLWYCYLDQDSMDSSFFYLDPDADRFKKLKSQDVIRLLIGFHQDRVIDLEEQLNALRSRRSELQLGAEALQSALSSTNAGSEEQIQERVDRLHEDALRLGEEIGRVRDQGAQTREHSVERLRNQARCLADEMQAIEQATGDVSKIISEDQRHLNELITLNLKFRRTLSARAVLEGVEFIACPRCAQHLPNRADDSCTVCGQLQMGEIGDDIDDEVIEQDISARKVELADSIKRHGVQMSNLRYRGDELSKKKHEIDMLLNQAMSQYDSAYLSSALDLERQKAAVEQEIRQVSEYRQLLAQASEMMKTAAELRAEEERVFEELKGARKEAERDTSNLKRLQELFLDSLIRAKIPGFSEADMVSLKSPDFYPAVINPDIGDAVVTQFGMLGSGGKKTLFKCCFAVAVHRLASEVGGMLPSLMVVDSPMKNISERENREQFEGFHRMLYELAVGELSNTQFVLVDKELCEVPPDIDLDLRKRYMTPGDSDNPPLVSYYRGH